MNITPASTGTATYCPEDNKLRLYVGRVPRDEYEALRGEGWTSTPKQSCQFVATWTPSREDTALAYGGGELDDEDQSPAERAADRAERFSMYRDKRADEAIGHANRYDAGPQVHGYQSAALAERKAARHDMIGTRATTQWEKAEYWQHRTAGVINHALHVSTPWVRMGRIKELEADIRKAEKDANEATAKNQGIWDIWNGLAGNGKLIVLSSCVYSLHSNDIKPAGENGKYTREQCALGMALMLISDVHTEYKSERYELQKKTVAELVDGTTTPEAIAKTWIENHPERPKDWNGGGRWLNHYRLRLAYENQMIEGQGGRAAFVEMEAGGWIGKHQIQKVNKSTVTGRVVSVNIIDPKSQFCDQWGNAYTDEKPRPLRLLTLNIERLKSDVYRAPTDEERAKFTDDKKAKAKARAADTTNKGPALINPTDEDAAKLQEIWNQGKKLGTTSAPKSIERMTQAEYSASSKGVCGHCEPVEITGGGKPIGRHYNSINFPTVAKIRAHYGAVIILTDKPQKPLTPEMWTDPRPAMREEVLSRFDELVKACGRNWISEPTEREADVFKKACMVKLAYSDSASQFGLTEAGRAILIEREQRARIESKKPANVQPELLAVG